MWPGENSSSSLVPERRPSRSTQLRAKLEAERVEGRKRGVVACSASSRANLSAGDPRIASVLDAPSTS